MVEAGRGDRFWGIGLGMGGKGIQVNGMVKMFRKSFNAVERGFMEGMGL